MGRTPFSLPYGDQVAALAALLADRRPLEPADPERLVAAALHHGLAGYLSRAVARGNLHLPDTVRGRLARGDAIRVLHARALRRELAAVAPELAEACGAAPVCIKGPAVADRFYAQASLRPFADLDLLVPQPSLGPAADALARLGYEPLHEFRPGFGERHGHDVHMARRVGDRRLDVELHWRVGDDPACVGLDHARLHTGRQLEVEGVAVDVPALPEQVLVLAVHLLSDRAKRLIWIQDLALAGGALCERDWRGAFALARELGLGWALYRALDYAARHLGFERERPLPPGPVLAWGPLRAVEELDLRASTHVGRLASLGWAGRARYLREVLLPTREGLAGTVGEDGAPTWRLVGRHLRTVGIGLRPRGR